MGASRTQPGPICGGREIELGDTGRDGGKYVEELLLWLSRPAIVELEAFSGPEMMQASEGQLSSTAS